MAANALALLSLRGALDLLNAECAEAAGRVRQCHQLIERTLTIGEPNG